MKKLAHGWDRIQKQVSSPYCKLGFGSWFETLLVFKLFSLVGLRAKESRDEGLSVLPANRATGIAQASLTLKP